MFVPSEEAQFHAQERGKIVAMPPGLDVDQVIWLVQGLTYHQLNIVLPLSGRKHIQLVFFTRFHDDGLGFHVKMVLGVDFKFTLNHFQSCFLF